MICHQVFVKKSTRITTPPKTKRGERKPSNPGCYPRFMGYVNKLAHYFPWHCCLLIFAEILGESEICEVVNYFASDFRFCFLIGKQSVFQMSFETCFHPGLPRRHRSRCPSDRPTRPPASRNRWPNAASVSNARALHPGWLRPSTVRESISKRSMVLSSFSCFNQSQNFFVNWTYFILVDFKV